MGVAGRVPIAGLSAAKLEYGRAIRALWALDAGTSFLNHGSFGACPLSVLREQDRWRLEMERNPDRFFAERIVPTREQTAVRDAAAELGDFVGVAGHDLAFVENPTTGTQAVLQSSELKAGDRILITTHQYNAVRLAVERRCAETGAEPLVVQLPLRTTSDEVRSRIREAADARVKLAIVDHITSATALVFPVREIVADFHERGIPVLIDGAHAAGQIPLDLAELQADWYVGSAHKWLYAPKGSAFLYASPRVSASTRPAITSHFVDIGFPRAFDYVGTRDNSNWLAVPAAIRFFRELDPPRMWRRNRVLLERASELLADLGAEPIGPLELCASMRTFVLPQARELHDDDGLELREMLWSEGVQVNSMTAFGSLLLRVCAQAYVDEEDLIRLASVLRSRGWPGRESPQAR